MFDMTPNSNKWDIKKLIKKIITFYSEVTNDVKNTKGCF